MKTEYIQELLFATSRRQTGKSHLLQEGIKDYDRPFMLVCRNIREGKRLTNNNQNATYITPETINNLKGSNSPIIFDQQEVLEYLQQILYHKNNLLQCKSSCKELPSKEIKDYNSFKTLFTALCFLAVIAVPVYAYMQNSKVEHDLSVVGNGTATVVQIHDPGCRLCNRLKSNLGEVKGDFKEEIQFKTANILKQAGKDFAKKYQVPHVTLLFFNKKGDRVDTMQGVSSAEDIRSSLERLAKRR